MSDVTADAGSFRDPGGRIFIDGQRVLRAVYQPSARDYEAVRESGLLDRFIAEGRLVDSREIDPGSHPAGKGAAYLLEHPRLPFISYPYEWPFPLHKRAALLQLDLMIDSLECGFTLSDATAYNVQFEGGTPRFIDHLSFRPYRDGEIWAGHRQFCMQFLNPLLMWSRLRVPPNPWFRGSLEGIAPEDLVSLLGWRDKFSWTVLAHVIAQGSAQRRANAGRVADKAELPRISKTAFKATLVGLRDFISKMTLSDQRTVWDSYDQDNSYGSAEAEAKRQFVTEMAAATKPGLLFDLGCNTGEYSAVAIESGAKFAVGFDFDFGALERAVARADEGKVPLLPLWLDATNPSPGQGWDERERKGFNARVRGDAVLALAFVHHLAIARNIPLDFVVDWIMRVAPVGIIEFPPKSDPMVQRLLSRRSDIFPDYDEQHFLAEVSNRARIVKSRSLSEGGRLLVWYDRTDR